MQKEAPTAAELELSSIKRFVAACLARGETLSADGYAEFEATGHSCYKEGYGYGFKLAAQLISDFMNGPAS